MPANHLLIAGMARSYDLQLRSLGKRRFIRHPRVGGIQHLDANWVPACAGTTNPNKSAFP